MSRMIFRVKQLAIPMKLTINTDFTKFPRAPSRDPRSAPPVAVATICRAAP